MSGWIKFEKKLKGDPVVKKVARAMRDADIAAGRYASVTSAFPTAAYVTIVLGGLAQLWFYADDHIRDDNTIPLGVDDINDVAGIEGFAQLLPEDWFVILDAETVELPYFLEHNGPEAKKNALGAQRQKRHRNKVTLQDLNIKRSSNASVTLDASPDRQTDRLDKTDKTQSRTARKSAPSVEPTELLDFKIAYPKRAGDQGWRKAQRAAHARITEGHTWRQMIEGAKRYAAHVRSTGNEGSVYVKQACTFLGPDKHFLLPWDPAPTKADLRLVSNTSAADEFMRRTEPGS